jgi:uncharacterized membrane protein
VASETGRIEAFSDGVFAIAITLLILEIRIPAVSDGNLSTQLARQWPSYLSFTISFAFIGIMWINHHQLFTRIRHSDHALLILNLLLLFGVCVVPFPTAVLAAHLGHSDQRAAAVLYNATYVFVALCFNLLWRYAEWQKRRLLGSEATESAVERIGRLYSVVPLVYVICLGLAFVSVRASLALNGALACFFALPPRMAWRTKE